MSLKISPYTGIGLDWFDPSHPYRQPVWGVDVNAIGVSIENRAWFLNTGFDIGYSSFQSGTNFYKQTRIGGEVSTGFAPVLIEGTRVNVRWPMGIYFETGALTGQMPVNQGTAPEPGSFYSGFGATPGGEIMIKTNKVDIGIELFTKIGTRYTASKTPGMNAWGLALGAGLLFKIDPHLISENQQM